MIGQIERQYREFWKVYFGVEPNVLQLSPEAYHLLEKSVSILSPIERETDGYFRIKKVMSMDVEIVRELKIPFRVGLFLKDQEAKIV